MGTDLYIYAEEKREGVWTQLDVSFPDDRDCVAFAILANVRNQYGIEPISAPRGTPCDTSIAEYLGWHDFSWVTLQELLDLNLDLPVTRKGFVTTEEAERFRSTGIPPATWRGWWTGADGYDGYELVRWEEPLREASFLLPEIIETLNPLGNPNDIRLVFGFVS